MPYLTILTMNVKNVINDNDYEFTLSAFAASFLALSSLSPSSISASSSTSSNLSTKENQFQLQQGQQQDLIKICVLLFDTYQKLCMSSSDDVNQKPIYISRQSIQESLLPGLSCLRDLFYNSIIINASSVSPGSISNTQNDYVALLDSMIYKLEHIQIYTNEPSTSPIASGSSNSISITLTPSPSVNIANNQFETSSISPLKASPGSLVGDVINASVNALSSSSASSFSTAGIATPSNQSGVNTDNSNFKSFVFKGITNFKDHSKDKLSNFLLTNKTFKK